VMKDRTVTTLDETEAQKKGQDAAAALWQRLRTMKPQLDQVLQKGLS
jgi:hypothetical protein